MYNKSPWIEQLNKKIPTRSLKENASCDVCIVGAGISGVTSAYYFLKDTTASVLLLEAKKLGHGATGHNAGQLASYLEESFESLVTKYGITKAIEAQRAILESWDLLDRIIFETKLPTKPHTFAGFAGCTRIEQVLNHL